MLRGNMRTWIYIVVVMLTSSVSVSAQEQQLSNQLTPFLSILLDSEDQTCTYTHPNAPTDDPNPLQVAGGFGRAAVSSNPIPDGYPTPLTTGLCGVGIHPNELTVISGMTIETDNTVLDGMDIQGTINIEANNVVIRNSRITSSGIYVLNIRSGNTGTVVEDTRIRLLGGNGSSAVQGYSPYILRRVHVTGGSDNLKAHAGVLVEDSYFTGTYKSEGSHNDVVQIRGGSGYQFRNSTFIGPWKQSTSAFIIQAKHNDLDDLVIENNYISGGGYSIYTNESNGYSMTNVFVTDNRFELDSWQYGWRSANAGTYSGNVQIPSR